MSEIVDLRAYAESVRRDLAVLTVPQATRGPVSEGASPNAVWMRLRNLCLDTAHPVDTVDASFQPETAFGGQVLAMIRGVASTNDSDVTYKRNDKAGLCIEAEPLFVSYANVSSERFRRVGEPKPVVIRSGEEFVGLFKPTERSAILGLVDMPEVGLFKGAISELIDPIAQEKIVDMAGRLDAVGSIEIADLFRVGAGMRVVRATTLAFDSDARDAFSRQNRVGRVGYQGTDDIQRQVNRPGANAIAELPLAM